MKGIKGVIFDLDGVIVSTDECHYLAWKQMADDENIYFDRRINERLRGVSRAESLEIILERSQKKYSDSQKLALSDRKNETYKSLIKKLTERDILPGVRNILAVCEETGLKTAIGSSSKNTKAILERIGLGKAFDAVVDGNDIARSKPDPEVFLKAAERISLPPAACLVVEDAEAGVEAALAGGMKVLAVGSASGYARAHYRAESLASVCVEELLRRD